MSLETEDTVFKEAYGGPHSSKSAYGLIYVNDYVADQQKQIPLIQYVVGSGLQIDQTLRKYVQETNLKFNDEVTKYQVDKIIRGIVDKFKHREEVIKNNIEH